MLRDLQTTLQAAGALAARFSHNAPCHISCTVVEHGHIQYRIIDQDDELQLESSCTSELMKSCSVAQSSNCSGQWIVSASPVAEWHCVTLTLKALAGLGNRFLVVTLLSSAIQKIDISYASSLKHKHYLRAMQRYQHHGNRRNQSVCDHNCSHHAGSCRIQLHR